MLGAVAIPDMIAKQRFGPEPETLENRDRSLLIDGHLRNDLPKTSRQRQRKNLLCQSPTNTAPAGTRAHDHTELADMRRP